MRIAFRIRQPAASLRHKEQLLILRDPWLISQSLMQLLYLSPPALLLWHNYGQAGGAIVLVPVLVMASGQLAGGLAWLTISGEDAPDLVRSAPVQPGRLLRAKVGSRDAMHRDCVLPFRRGAVVRFA